MKWPKQHFDILDSAFSQFIQNCGFTVEQIRSELSTFVTPMAGFYRLYNMITADLLYDDTHPRYRDNTLYDGTELKAKKRFVKYVPGFQLYPAGCNDTHLATALKALGKKHGLLD